MGNYIHYEKIYYHFFCPFINLHSFTNWFIGFEFAEIIEFIKINNELIKEFIYYNRVISTMIAFSLLVLITIFYYLHFLIVLFLDYILIFILFLIILLGHLIGSIAVFLYTKYLFKLFMIKKFKTIYEKFKLEFDRDSFDTYYSYD